MRLASARRTLLATACALLFAASDADAATIYQADFDPFLGTLSFSGTFFKNAGLQVDQNTGTATLEGVGSGFNAAASNEKILLPDLAELSLDVLTMSGTLMVKVVYFDEFGALIDPAGEILIEDPTSGTSSAMLGSTMDGTPEDAAMFRIQIILGGPQGENPGSMATLDHLQVVTVPEPGTLALVCAGMAMLAHGSRRRA